MSDAPTFEQPFARDPSVAVPVRLPYRPVLTQFLVVINVLVYVAMAMSSHSLAFNNQQLFRWGADSALYTFGGQGWRIWTSTFVHANPIHIAGNMWCLWNLGLLAERILGRWVYFATYAACGTAASITSLSWASFSGYPGRLSVGASGAIMGLAGVLIAVLHFAKLPFPQPALHAIKRSLLRFTGLTLLLGVIPVVDNSAHVGGLLMGLAVGALLGPRLADAPEQRAGFERLLFIGVALFLLGGWTYVKRVYAYVVPLRNATEALENGKAPEAVPELESIVRQRPKDALVVSLLASAYLQQKDYPHAEQALKRVLALKPGDMTAQFNLGLVYGATARYAEARQQFAAVTRRTPNNDEAWVMLGSSLKELHKPDEAEHAFQRAVELNPKNLEAYRELGWVQLEQQQTDAALLSFQRAVAISSRDPDSELGLGRAYMAKHMSKEASEALERYHALKNAPAKE